jgi:uncharacterized protein (DUF2062 family)
MTTDERALNKLRGERIRRVKRWLRPLPRRANIHRYPGLKWFAESARKRAYIWSFRLQHLVPAIYSGCILAFLPLFGIQLPLALLLAILLRANLPVLAGVQFISNPVTILPIYFSAYQIGRIFLGIFGVEVPFLGRRKFEAILVSLREGQWGENFITVAQVFGVTSLGGAIVGLAVAATAVTILKFVLKRAEASYELLSRRIIHKHKEPQ